MGRMPARIADNDEFLRHGKIAVRQLGMPVEAALAPLVEQEKIGARKIAVIRHDEHGAVRQCRRLVQAERIVRFGGFRTPYSGIFFGIP